MTLPPLILASASPRRVELLRRLQLDFRIVPSAAGELRHDQFTACELAQFNAYRKAKSVAGQFPNALVLGADTLVCVGGLVLGKPADLCAARRMLHQLQGETHQVVTGVCLIHRDSRRRRVFSETTDVRFKPLTDAQIDQYLASIDPLDKAGAYAIQEGGEFLLQEMAGSYSNVVGLPVERLRAELAAWSASGPAENPL
jgi:nucleoside triphosphate pyrophosphatase